MTGFTEATFRVLAELEANNTKAWFDANRDRLYSDARAPFEAMLDSVTMRLAGSKCPLAGSARTMFRQNRDVRFSKDKRPYKPTVSGMITPSGTKSGLGGVVYAQVGPQAGLLAAGFYKLGTADLGLMRDRIIAEPERFSEIAAALAARGLPLSTEDTLRTMPRGYADHDDHPLAGFLKLKSYTVHAPQPKPIWISGDIVQRMVDMALAVAPLLAFGRDALARRSD